MAFTAVALTAGGDVRFQHALRRWLGEVHGDRAHVESEALVGRSIGAINRLSKSAMAPLHTARRSTGGGGGVYRGSGMLVAGGQGPAQHMYCLYVVVFCIYVCVCKNHALSHAEPTGNPQHMSHSEIRACCGVGVGERGGGG